MLGPALFAFIFVLILCEFSVLCVFLLRRNRRAAILPLFCFLLSGAALMGALWLGLHAEDVGLAIQALLGLSFVGHVGALYSGWRLIR